MNDRPLTSIPESVIQVFFWLMAFGLCIGVLYGLNVISGAVLDILFFSALVIFVPWAVWKLDPRGLDLFADSDSGES